MKEERGCPAVLMGSLPWFCPTSFSTFISKNMDPYSPVLLGLCLLYTGLRFSSSLASRPGVGVKGGGSCRNSE